MSILSDGEIRRLCTTPNIYLHPEDDEESILTYMSKADQRAYLNKHGVMSSSTPTEEQLANWQPMISPFVGESVRFVNREPTELEEFQFSRHMSREEYPKDWVVEDGKFQHVNQRVISFGNSSYGYDARIADEFKVFTNIHSGILDPKNFDEKSFVDHKGPYCIIPPNSFVLARTVERFKMSKDVIGLCFTKSTYARIGCVCVATPLEPEWEGWLTLEYSNTTPLPSKLYANEGGLQILFFRGEIPPEITYAMRNGKYNHQLQEITLPKA